MALNWNWLDRKLKRVGLTYHELHHNYGFHHSTFKGWDAGRRPKMHTIRKLARILNLPPDLLIRNLGVKPLNSEKMK